MVLACRHGMIGYSEGQAYSAAERLGAVQEVKCRAAGQGVKKHWEKIWIQCHSVEQWPTT